jgi:hypothetical protein
MLPTMIGSGSLALDESITRTIALFIQLGGILTLLYSALNPYST